MAKKGTCLLPLHYGTAPRWLFDRMVRLSRGIVSAIVTEYGSDEFIEIISDPFWFQALGCVLGFDWHSSGLTTTVCGALKQALRGTEKDMSIFVAGGKGASSRKTPSEIEIFIKRYLPSLDFNHFTYASHMSAKVDNTALQDGYQLYHHAFIFSGSGKWAVVQQGMNTEEKRARRYHWLSDNVTSFVSEPEKAICCDHCGPTFNMVALESEEARRTSALISREKPDKTIREIGRISRLNLPREHTLFLKNLKITSLKKVLLSTYEKQPEDFEKLLGIQGIGPNSLRAMALLAELIYDAKISRIDPVKYSFAHGGKDGHPYPIDRERYDRSIDILEKAVTEAGIERSDKKNAFKRLAAWRF